jgi:pimeloyl-ACP methyl ester carboxylesterase
MPFVEPWLRYANTADGVSIAYTVAGDGPPLVRITGGLWDHAQGYWRIPPMRRQLERIASQFTHIQYDARGTGLSQRGVADFRLDAQLRDLEAVVGANNLDRFDVLAHFTGGFAAMAYAARNPDRVTRLVLFRPHARGEHYFNATSIRAMAAYRQMAADDWYGYLGTVANRALRFEHPDIARRLVGVYNESMTPETIHLFEDQYREIDVTAEIEKIHAPTLIIVESGRSGFPDESWREVASLIPNMSLQLVSANMPLAYLDEATDAILSFLAERGGSHLAAPPDGLQVLLFVALDPGSTALEARIRDLVRARGALSASAEEGGLLAAFRSAQQALESATQVQASARQEYSNGVRIGIDATDPGDSGARDRRPSWRAIEAASLAGPGEVLVTDVVRQLVTGKGFQFSARPESIREGEDSTRLYQLSRSG